MHNKPASTVIMELAMSALKDPYDPPAEVALLAVQLATLAWNRSLGAENPSEYFANWRKIPRADRRGMWRHSHHRDPEATVEALCEPQVAMYPDEHRLILECTRTPDGTVKAKWGNTFPH